eukprot:CAMPEP_0178950546 /NCGR_PEP_ID=MMETSP0789-20121207/6716_1 /TAXON_ID=3005 /ORGANISM="Rhizosolenia setigera, Strain CCMP 1694" /LENGTH=355 /DNA_ID=CAMNT_0020631291 /DNA_START=7 /DNA_END=1074 /DNA_ORIENTATION=+
MGNTNPPGTYKEDSVDEDCGEKLSTANDSKIDSNSNATILPPQNQAPAPPPAPPAPTLVEQASKIEPPPSSLSVADPTGKVSSEVPPPLPEPANKVTAKTTVQVQGISFQTQPSESPTEIPDPEHQKKAISTCSSSSKSEMNIHIPTKNDCLGDEEKTSNNLNQKRRKLNNNINNNPEELLYKIPEERKNVASEPYPAILVTPATHSNFVLKLNKSIPQENDKIKIFNRKTGIIMTGEEAIQYKDLHKELQTHSEYEPILSAKQEGRSSASQQIIVKEHVTAQKKKKSHYLNRAIGQKVLVMSGTYKGSFGTISHILPGGWIKVAGIKKKFIGVDVVLKSSQLVEIDFSSNRRVI